MKTKIISIGIFAMLIANFGMAQATYEGNDPTAPAGSYLGWDNLVNFPLEIRHDANQPIIFSTNATERMRIAQWGNAAVGGSINPRAKLEVVLNNDNAAEPPFFESTALMAYNRFMSEEPGGPVNRGIRAISDAPNNGPNEFDGVNMAGTFWARRGAANVGVFGNASWVENLGPEASVSGNSGTGVAGVARGHRIQNVGIEGRVGIHPDFPGAWTVAIVGGADPLGTNSWAGWFEGDIFHNGSFVPSDADLKQNVEELSGALELIQQIEPKTYQYLTEEYEFMNFPDGEQYGVLAQDLYSILPGLTRDASKPTQLDSVGNEITPAIEFKAVNYTGLIPILIAGMKEQQSIIEAQNEVLGNVMDQLNDLQQQINYCCSGGEGFKNYNPGGSEEQQIDKSTSPNGNKLNQNTPNPFRSQTIISYTLEQGGKVMLNVYDKNGKVLETLSETEQQPGDYRYEWDASGLPAGLYHYALYVDGELMVKKAIKLQD